jgi:glutamate racemase
MLKNIATRVAQPTLTYHGNSLARNKRGARFSCRPRGIPSAFPDWREMRMPAPRRPYFTSTFVSSTASQNSNERTEKTTPPALTPDEIKQRIAEKNEVFAPPLFDKSALADRYRKKKLAIKLVEEFAQKMTVPKDDKLHDISRQSLSEHLLATVDTLASASMVMIFCGRNTTEGKLTPDGPVSAAIAAYALHLCYKVPIIVCDGPNKRLIQTLLTELHPEFGPYVRYLPITDVNGRLVSKLYKELTMHAPDVTLYIDVPGRNSESDYLDENGNSISLLNVAFDQALNMQNAMKKQSIAICNKITNAGFPVAISTGEAEDIAAVVRATHALVVPDVVQGTLGLMELLCNACDDSKAYQTEWLLAALNRAAELTERREYAAPQLRSGAVARQSWTMQKPVEFKEADQRIQQLAAFHELASKRRVTWTAPIEKGKLEGPKVRHAVLFDSSDGVLIAAEDFLRYARARSNFYLKAHAVADHDKASYGDHKGHRLFEIVVDGIAYSAKLKADVIVMVCNTACTVDLDRARKAVGDWLHAQGINGYEIQIIDLVKTVSEAVLDSGGARPTLLTTEGTMRSDAYPKSIKASAARHNVDLPEVKVIGCGDRKERPNKDLARFVNDLAHMKDSNSPAYQELMHEVRRYVDLIPLNSSSVWLCCTHFPALKDIIKAALNERLAAAELPPDSIPLIDPLFAQVDETIRFLQRHPLTANQDYRNLVDLQVSTTGPKVKVAESVHHHIKKRNVPLFEVRFPNVKIQPAPEPRAQPAAHGNQPES